MDDVLSRKGRTGAVPSAQGLDVHIRLLESLSEGVSVSRQDGVIVYTNPAEDRLFGYAAGELIGKHVSEQNAYPPEENARLVQAVFDELNAHGVWRGEWVNRRKDGGIFITSSHIMPVNWNGSRHWLCVQRDITRGDDGDGSRFALAAEAAELGIWEWDLISNRFHYSERAKAICGFPLGAEVTYDDVVSVTHPDDFPVTSAQAQRAFDPVLRDRSPYEYRLLRRDGETRWVRAHGYAVFGQREGATRALRYVGTLQDITAEKLAREAERAAADQLRLALDAAQMAVWRVDLRTRVLAHSPKLNLLYGISPNEQPSLAELEALYVDKDVLEERWKSALEARASTFEDEYPIIRRDGAQRWLAVRCEIQYDADGAPLEALGVLTDVTERRRALDALRESDRRFREAANSAPAPVWMTNSAGAVEFCNDAMAKFAGADQDELLGDYWLTLIHPDDIESVRAARASAWSENRRAYDFEARFKHADGSWRWMHVSSQPRRDPSGNFHGYVGIAMDRTDVHVALGAMQSSEARFRGIFENAQVALWEEDFSEVLNLLDDLRAQGVTDLRSHLSKHPTLLEEAIERVGVSSVNPYAVQLFEAENAEVLKASLHRVFAPETTELFIDELVALWNGARRFEGETRLQTLSGKPVDTLISISFDGPRCEQTLASLTDISARKDAERRLQALDRVSRALTKDLNLERIVQTATDAATELIGAKFGAFFYNLVNEEGESYTLYTLSGAPREAFERFGLPRNTAVFRPTFTGEGVVRSDDIRKDPRYGKSAPHHGMPKGHLPVVSYLAVPVISSTGHVHGGLFFGHDQPSVFTADAETLVSAIAAQAAVAIDNAQLFEAARTELAQRRRAEADRELLINELNHRVKNTLATVQSLALQSLRNPSDSQAGRDAFIARLTALARAHDLLTQRNWQSADIGDVVRQALLPFASEPRLAVEGPAAQLTPRQSLSLALALHELATNAVKYGALSNATGQVAINWLTRETQNEERRLTLHWREVGGPPVAKPQRVGFGSRLIDQYLARDLDGAARIDFKPDGVLAEIEISLARPIQVGTPYPAQELPQ